MRKRDPGFFATRHHAHNSKSAFVTRLRIVSTNHTRTTTALLNFIRCVETKFSIVRKEPKLCCFQHFPVGAQNVDGSLLCERVNGLENTDRTLTWGLCRTAHSLQFRQSVIHDLYTFIGKKHKGNKWHKVVLSTAGPRLAGNADQIDAVSITTSIGQIVSQVRAGNRNRFSRVA